MCTRVFLLSRASSDAYEPYMFLKEHSEESLLLEVKAKFESLDPIHRRRVRVGVRVREQTRYVRAQYEPQLLNFPLTSRS